MACVCRESATHKLDQLRRGFIVTHGLQPMAQRVVEFSVDRNPANAPQMAGQHLSGNRPSFGVDEGLYRHFLVSLPATISDTQANKAPMMIDATVGTIASAGDRGFNRINPATDAKP